MKSVIFTEYSLDLTNVHVGNTPIPCADKTHVVIKIFSAAINPVDAKIAAGYIAQRWPTTLPFTPGYDCAGIIHELPTDYSGDDFKVNDKVFTCNWGTGKHWDNDSTSQGGCFAEFGVFPIHKIAKIPESLSYDVAAASALVTLTAYQALFECLNLQNGQKILILGGAGAVGSLGIQLAKNIGCWIATTASPRNNAIVTKAGANKIVDYTARNWWEDPELKGIDHIFDAIGENDFFQHAHSNGVVRKGGSMVSICGRLSGYEDNIGDYTHLSNYCLHHSAEQLKIIADSIVAGKLFVDIDEVFPFDQAGVNAIYKKQSGGKSNGKNIFRIASE